MSNIHAFSSLTVSSGVLLVGTCIAGMLITFCCMWHCKKKGIAVNNSCIAFLYMCTHNNLLLTRVGVAQRGSVVVRVRILVCLRVCLSLLRTS